MKTQNSFKFASIFLALLRAVKQSHSHITLYSSAIAVSVRYAIGLDPLKAAGILKYFTGVKI